MAKNWTQSQTINYLTFDSLLLIQWRFFNRIFHEKHLFKEYPNKNKKQNCSPLET